jgi:uncharacterized membrane protein AbrB (regulator of aidB expression)
MGMPGLRPAVLAWAAGIVLAWAAGIVLAWAAGIVLAWAAGIVLAWASRTVLALALRAARRAGRAGHWVLPGLIGRNLSHRCPPHWHLPGLDRLRTL